MSERLKQYQERLETNPRFQQSTIRNYERSIERLIKQFGPDPTVPQLNKFIAEKVQKRQPYVKAAIREYLIMLGRGHEYFDLVQAKIRKPVRKKVFLNRLQLSTIVDNVKRPMYKTIASLHVATAARASELITIEKRRIHKEETRIRITLMGKGDKPRAVFLKSSYWEVLQPYCTEHKKYIFLEREAKKYTRRRLLARVKTIYERYREQLKDASKKCNMDITTHDIRRSVANLVKIQTNDPRMSQKLLDHSSMDVTERYLHDDSEVVSEVLLEHQEGVQVYQNHEEKKQKTPL